MTPAQFKARYAWAAAIPDATIAIYLADAEQDLGPASGWGGAWDRATGLLAAHRLTIEGQNPTAQGAAIAASGLQSVKSGTLSMSVASSASASLYGGSVYGRELMALGARYRGTGPTVIIGDELMGGVGASPFAKDAPFWSIPTCFGGQ